MQKKSRKIHTMSFVYITPTNTTSLILSFQHILKFCRPDCVGRCSAQGSTHTHTLSPYSVQELPQIVIKHTLISTTEDDTQTQRTMAFRGVVAVAVLLLAGVSDCLELGKPMPGVTELTSKNYKKSVTDGRNWLIEFYAPWCSWCKKLAPEWKLLGQSVKGSKEVAAGKVNVDSDVSDVCYAALNAKYQNTTPPQIVDKYNIKGYPTIILVRPDGKWVCTAPMLSFHLTTSLLSCPNQTEKVQRYTHCSRVPVVHQGRDAGGTGRQGMRPSLEATKFW